MARHDVQKMHGGTNGGGAMKHTEMRKVTDERGNVWTINVTLDYSNHTKEQLVEKAFSYDVIKLQQPWRKLSNNELERMQTEGYRAVATPKGTRTGAVRVMTPDEMVKYIQEHPEYLEKIQPK